MQCCGRAKNPQGAVLMKTPIHDKGFALLEAMITLVIVVFGVLGLVGLQSRMTVAEMESYQRSQAIVLANDMAQRIMANPKGAPCYVGKEAGNVSSAPAACSGIVGTNAAAIQQQVDADFNAWHNALKGVAEKNTSTGKDVGAMIGARGCIADIDTATPEKRMLVTVAWQGLSETVATPVTCGSGNYLVPGTATASDALRKTVSVAVFSAKLD